MHATPDRFLGIEGRYADYAAARYAILPVPYEGTVSYAPGTADGPRAVIEASKQVEWFDEELLAEFYQAGVATLAPVPPASDVEEQMARVAAAARRPIDDGKFLLALGGEHSITPPIVRQIARRHGDISVLQLDAHADLRDSYVGGGKCSHASAMRRVLEITPRIAQVGIRNFSLEEYQSCPEQAKRFITPAVVESDPRWIDRVLGLLGEKVYLTLDIDGFDSSEAPGTGTPEPGGLSWRQVIAMLRRVCSERQVVGADIVEVRPLPPSNVTEFLAARLAYKIIAYTQAR